MRKNLTKLIVASLKTPSEMAKWTTHTVVCCHQIDTKQVTNIFAFEEDKCSLGRRCRGDGGVRGCEDAGAEGVAATPIDALFLGLFFFH